MNCFKDRRIPETGKGVLAALLMAAFVAGCGGGSGGSAATTPAPAASCDPADATTFGECGTLFVGLTDADGDFLSYNVDVVSLELETAAGRRVETLPSATRIDFAQYVDLTEFVTAASIPPGTYVAGSITLDYADAEVFVEAGGAAKAAQVVDADGRLLGETTLDVSLADRNQLVVTRGRPALLTVDFDLAASHRVDVLPDPAIATAEPFIVAEIDPVDTKTFRVRGLLESVDEAAQTYTIALRPFHRPDGDFGDLAVHVTGDTEFEVNGDLATGQDGLAALSAAGSGTLTLATGTLDVTEREFTAELVLAGSSVPGSEFDAVRGHVITRDGDELTVRGATIIQSDRAFFRDDVTVTIGPDTRIYKDGHDALLDSNAVSVGQAVTVLGDVTHADAPGTALDATAGAVRMQLTHLSGVATTVMPGQLDMKLDAIGRRRVQVFDFSGTGPSAELDADPANYEVATGALTLGDQAAGKPVVARGFPTAFGTAPPDFDGRTVIDFGSVRSTLGIGWGADGTTAPFLSMNTDGLLLDNGNAAVDERHFIKQGPVLIALATLDSDTLLVPPGNDSRTVYALKTADSVRLFADFAEFVEALTAALDGATAARSMYARGSYDAEANVFTAYKVGLHLLAP